MASQILSRFRETGVAIMLAIALAMVPIDARAYCVYSTPNANRLAWPPGFVIPNTIDPTGADFVAVAAALGAINAAQTTWNTTPPAPRWTYMLGGAGAGSPFVKDGVNQIGFQDLGLVGYDSNTYGVTCIWYVVGGPNDGLITEIGIALNTSPARTWHWAIMPMTDAFVSIESIALHELGHGLGIAHSSVDGSGFCAEAAPFYDPGPVMQPLYSPLIADNPDRANTALRADDVAANSLPVAGELFKGQAPRPTVATWRLRRATLPPKPVRGATFQTKYYLYPSACVARAGGTWGAQTTPWADSLNTYFVGTTGAYTAQDLSASGSPPLWQIQPGNTPPMADDCAPLKTQAADRLFFGGDGATFQTVPGSKVSIVACDFPIPGGTGGVFAQWSEYDDLPRGSGFVQNAEYRISKAGSWYDWKSVAPAGDMRVGSRRSWATVREELAEAEVDAASLVQLRFNLECVPYLAADHNQCTPIPLGLLYDDLRLDVTPGTALPVFGVFSGSLAQSTFIDGTMKGTNCTVTPCWPGLRGTDLGPCVGVDDNFNSPFGDSIVVTILSGRGVNGNGINWNNGFDKTVVGGCGKVLGPPNPAFIPGFGAPMVVFRLFDPATKTWSPWDQSELDADDVQFVAGVPIVAGSRYRMDWPPRDKLAAGAVLPGGFTIKGVAAYAGLSFLPHGTRLQYFFTASDNVGAITNQFSSDNPMLEVEDLPNLPGTGTRVPDIMEFDVLPRVYPGGTAGTQLAGKFNTPVLNLDTAYSAWSFKRDPVTQALRNLGVRADRYRLLQGLGEGANIGGRELPGQHIDQTSNYFPSRNEYGIRDSLALWYRIIILSGHLSGDWTVIDEQDAALLRDWWYSSTPGFDGGDRCLFVSGDDVFRAWLNPPYGGTEQSTFASEVFGVASASAAWSGASTTPYPTIDDRFAAPTSGPGLAAPGSYTYPIDGGCPNPKGFDGLSKVGAVDAAAAALYPGGAPDVAGIARSRELDVIPDRDRSKSLGYAYSIQFIRGTSTVPDSYYTDVRGFQNRMQVLYKFLTGCRGARVSPGDTGQCWPCPTDQTQPMSGGLISLAPQTTPMTGNWATEGAAFQTSLYGPLYAMQDNTTIVGVTEGTPRSTPAVNELFQNQPNPFNPETVIRFTLTRGGRVVIRIYDVAGRSIRTLLDARKDAGPYAVRWGGEADSGERAASGVYFYKITYPDGSTSAKKMTVLR